MEGTKTITALFVGGLIGLFTSALIGYLRQRHEIILKVIDKFFEMRIAVGDTVSRIATESLRRSLDVTAGEALRLEVSKLFYKYYDVLTRQALDDMVCLFVALGDPDGRVYSVKKDRDHLVWPLEREDVVKLAQSISHYRNTKVFTLQSLASQDPNIRYNAAVNLHARKILITFSRTLDPRNLMRLSNFLFKPIPVPHPEEEMVRADTPP